MVGIAPVKVAIIAGMLEGQDPGLVERDVAQSLAFRRELLLFFFLALIFSHAEVIGDGDGVGSNGSINAVLK